MSIADNFNIIRTKVNKATEKSGRNPEDITIIAVTKTADEEQIKELYDLGIRIFGESRIQIAESKIQNLTEFKDVSWHLIGHLQRNKVKKALELFRLIHSLDSLRLAQEINNRAKDLNIIAKVLIEINPAEEENKYGLKVVEAIPFLENLKDLQNIKIEGLMCMAPWSEDQETSRPYFKAVKNLFEEIKKLSFPNVEMQNLSMGMSDDFEVAIEEGSNMVRVGRAFFYNSPPD